MHSFLKDHLFYPLALSSALACAILAARILRVESATFIFLVWNLFLAWVPYMWSLWAASIERRHPRAWWRLLLPGALWLLFFPNAPYIVTDFVHLRERPPVPLWYDLGLLAAFALARWRPPRARSRRSRQAPRGPRAPFAGSAPTAKSRASKRPPPRRS
jgi:hypothetical protein